MTHSPKSETKPKAKPSLATSAEWSFEAIGTVWWIGIYEAISEETLTGLKARISQRIEDFDKTYSRFRDDSLVTQISKKAGEYVLPEDSQRLIDFYHELYELTDCAVTPLIGQTLSDAGYDAEYSLESKSLSKPPRWQDVMSYESGKLTTHKPVLLDFGATGKGYLVDIVSSLLQASGIEAFCVDAGGDMVYRNPSEPLTVGLEHPLDNTQVIGTAELLNQALCGSSITRRVWEGYHHIIDPKSLQSPTDILAIWVVAGSAMLADGLTTALFFTTSESLLGKYQFEYVIVHQDQSLSVSDGFNGIMYT